MTLTLRRAVVLLVLLASMAVQTGCWVFSVYPLAASDDDAIFDKLLAGNWWNPQKGCSISFSRFPDEKTYRVVYSVSKDGGDNCWLGNGQGATFLGTVVDLGSTHFLDVYPADQQLQNHMMLTHSFYRLRYDVNSLSITPMNRDYVKSLVTQEKLSGIDRSDEMTVLTVNTKELREFMRQNVANDDLWQDARKINFQRRFEGQ